MHQIDSDEPIHSAQNLKEVDKKIFPLICEHLSNNLRFFTA